MIRTCKACGQKNSIPFGHLADTGKCGKCKAPLEPMAEPLDVGAKEFRAIVNTAKVPVLVDFWAEWCGPCLLAAPEVRKVAEQMAGKALVLKVNTDVHPDLAQLFKVRGIPNFLVLKGGEIVLQQPGLVDHRELQGWLEKAAA